MIAQTSKKAYRELKPFLSGKRKEIYEFFLNHPQGATRQEIAKWYRLKECSVCGRVSELLSNGHLVVCGVKKDKHSGKDTQILKAVKRIA